MTSDLERKCNQTPRVTITTTYGKAPALADKEWEPAHNWKVTLRRDGRQVTTPFYGGDLVGEPTAADVLSSLLLDATSAEYAGSFEEWANELGYDTDSRRAERMYKACERTAAKLRRFLGDDFDAYARAEH